MNYSHGPKPSKFDDINDYLDKLKHSGWATEILRIRTRIDEDAGLGWLEAAGLRLKLREMEKIAPPGLITQDLFDAADKLIEIGKDTYTRSPL